MKPTLVLVGRPNVGKSTLFNRLTKSRDAIVADMPGLTRDRHYGHGKVGKKPFLVVDTGGFEPLIKDGILHEMARQTEQAIVEADVVVFVVDGRTGLTPHDKEIAQLLRRSERPVLVAVNKAEGMVAGMVEAEFHALGLGEPLAISAAHGEGVRHLVDLALADFPEPEDDEWHSTSTRVAIVAYPRISNLDEFQPLKNVPGVSLTWARHPAALAGADWIILPGSKATAADLAWLRAQRLDAAIAAHAAQGGRVLGICGGLQMLGEALIDLHGVEPEGNGPGLGLLPLVTRFEPDKTVRHATRSFGDVIGPWSALASVPVSGYEIHSGRTAQHPAMAAQGDVAREVMAGLAWQNLAGNVLGVYLHGLFEDAAVLRALFGAGAPSLGAVFDGLADAIERAFEPGVLAALIQ